MAGGAGSNTGTPAASNPLGPQQGQGTPAFGGQQQPSMPSFATPQQQPGKLMDGFGGQQNNASLLMYPQNPTPYTGNPNQTFNNLMGGLGGFGGGQQTSSPTNFGPMANYGQGNGGGFGGQQLGGGLLMPAGGSPFSSVNSTTQQDMMRGGSGKPFGQVLGQLGFGGFGGQQQQQPQQPLSFDQWKQQPRMRDQAFRTPEQQLQRDQQGYQQYLSGTRGMQSPPPMQNPFQQQQPSNMRTMGQIFGFGGGQQQQYGGFPGFFGGGQQPGLVTDAEDRAQMSRSQTGRQQPMQNPFQPQQPSFMQDPEFQGYQTQMQQPLNQQRYDPIQAERAYYERMASQRQQPMQQRQFQQPSPFRRGQFQQPAGIQGLMAMLGGRGGMQQPMSMDMPQTYGHMEALPQNFMKKGGKV